MDLIISRRQNGYDVIVELGYIDAPPLPGGGSAIFIHAPWPDYSGTGRGSWQGYRAAGAYQKKQSTLTSRFQPITKNCRAHADVGRTECDSNLVIPAHSHTELFQLMTQSNFTQ